MTPVTALQDLSSSKRQNFVIRQSVDVSVSEYNKAAKFPMECIKAAKFRQQPGCVYP
jgi:hypothetical protein